MTFQTLQANHIQLAMAFEMYKALNVNNSSSYADQDACNIRFSNYGYGKQVY